MKQLDEIFGQGARGAGSAAFEIALYDEALRFEMLLTDLSRMFINLPAPEIDGAITGALRQIVEFLDVDRSSVALMRDEGMIEVTHSYRRPGVAALPPLFALSKIPWFASKIIRGETFIGSRLPDDLPEEAVAERAFVAQQGLRAQLTVPLVGDGKVLGAVGIGSFRAHGGWSPHVLRRLRLIGEILAGALLRKRAHEEIQRAQRRSHAILASLSNPVAVIDRNGTVRDTNAAWQSFSRDAAKDEHPPIGLGVGECYARALAAPPTSDARDAAEPRHDAIAAVMADAAPSATLEYRWPTSTGDRWFLMAATPLDISERGVVVSHTDITDLKRAQEDLRRLSGRLIAAHEEERSRVARELHDDLNQRVALLAIELEQVLARQRVSGPVAAAIQAAIGHARDLSTDIHRLSHSLHPSKLEHLGLVSAVKAMCAEFRARHAIEVLFAADSVPRGLAPEIALSFYRIAQEALQNVARHSQSREARLEIRMCPPRLTMTIRDAGRGFDPSERRTQSGLGLTSMRERVRLVGGAVTIDSRPGAGTTIEVAAPYRDSSR